MDDDSVGDLKSELLELREKYNNLKVAKAKLADELHDIHTGADDVSAPNSPSTSPNSKQRSDALERQIRELREEVAERHGSNSGHEAAEEYVVKSLQEELQMLRQSEKTTEARLNVHERRSAAAGERERKLSEEIAAARSELQEAYQLGSSQSSTRGRPHNRDESPDNNVNQDLRKKLALAQQALVARDRVLRQKDKQLHQLNAECNDCVCTSEDEPINDLIALLRSELSESREQLGVAEKRLGATQVENKKLRKEKNSLDKVGLTRELDAEVARLREDLKVARAETRKLRQADGLRAASPDHDLQSEVKNLRVELEDKSRQLRAEEKEKVSRAKESLARIGRDVSEVGQEASAQAMECKSLENTVEALQTELAVKVRTSVRNEDNALRAVERARRAQDEDVAAARRDAAQQVHQEISKAEARLQTMVNSESAQVDEARRHARTQSKQCGNLQEEISSSQELVAALRAELMEGRVIENQIMNPINYRDKEIAHLLEAVETRKAENTRLTKDFDELPKLAELTEATAQKDRELAQLRSEFALLTEGQGHNAQQRLHDLADAVASKDREVILLRKELMAFMEKADSYDVRQLSDDLIAKDADVAQLRTELIARDAHIEGCKTALEGASREKHELLRAQAGLLRKCEDLIMRQDGCEWQRESLSQDQGAEEEEKEELRRLYSALDYLEKLVERSFEERQKSVELRKRVVELESQVTVNGVPSPELLDLTFKANKLIAEEVGTIALDQLVALKSRIIEARDSILHGPLDQTFGVRLNGKSVEQSIKQTLEEQPMIVTLAEQAIPSVEVLPWRFASMEAPAQPPSGGSSAMLNCNLPQAQHQRVTKSPMPNNVTRAITPDWVRVGSGNLPHAAQQAFSSGLPQSTLVDCSSLTGTSSRVPRSSTPPAPNLRDAYLKRQPAPVSSGIATPPRPASCHSWTPLQSAIPQLGAPVRLGAVGAVGTVSTGGSTVHVGEMEHLPSGSARWRRS